MALKLEVFMKDYFSEQQKIAIAYFKANLAEWLKNPLYKDKYAIIYDSQLVGIFDEFSNAYREAEMKCASGEYIIQQLVDPKEVVHICWPAMAPAAV
jgi:hypothetical protein